MSVSRKELTEADFANPKGTAETPTKFLESVADEAIEDTGVCERGSGGGGGGGEDKWKRSTTELEGRREVEEAEAEEEG